MNTANGSPGMLLASLTIGLGMALGRWFQVPSHDGHSAEVPTGCMPSNGEVVRISKSKLALSGEYALELVATRDDSAARTRASGLLTLKTTPKAFRASGNREVTFPFYGSTSIDLHQLGYIPLAHPTTSMDPARPGVQVSYDSGNNTVSLTLGNSYGPAGQAVHAGVLLDVRSITNSSIKGNWNTGGVVTNSPEGYYCLERRTATKNDGELRQ